jgi:hypothetical protein
LPPRILSSVTPEDKKLRLDNFLILNRAVLANPSNYCEIIFPMHKAKQLIELCRLLEIRSSGVDYWCDCNYLTRKERGCPHGYGGPGYDHNGSHFSEMGQLESWDATEYEYKTIADEFCEILAHVDRIWKEEAELPCLSLGLSLITPADWRTPESLRRT